MTRIIVGLSEFTQAYGLFVLALIVALVFAFGRAMQNPARKERWHELMLNMPGMGRWIRMANISDWARSLGVFVDQWCSRTCRSNHFFSGGE